MRAPSLRNRFLGGGSTGKKLSLGTLYLTIMLENVSVDVVDGARVKGACWGCPSVPPVAGKGLREAKELGCRARSAG